MRIEELFDGFGDRTVAIRSADGAAVLRVKATHAAGILVTGLMIAPRLTATAALGALFAGIRLELEEAAGPLTVAG